MILSFRCRETEALQQGYRSRRFQIDLMASQRKKLPAIRAGQILREDLRDAGISLNRLARDLRVPMNRISAIVNGTRSITADTALRLARYFGTSAQYWMNLQAAYDIEAASQKLASRIERDVLPRAAA